MDEKKFRKEYKKLRKIFATMSPNMLNLADGLLVQAARHKVQLDELAADIAENGSIEEFQNSPNCDPIERERPASKLFVSLDRQYQAIMKQLFAMCPAEAGKSRLKELADE